MYAIPVRHRNRLLLRHNRFVERYPNLQWLQLRFQNEWEDSTWKVLVEEAGRLGYDPAGTQSKLQWGAMRILLHIGSTRVEDITFAHLLELRQVLEQLGQRDDIALFFGSKERYQE
jgi:hypothetical protein